MTVTAESIVRGEQTPDCFTIRYAPPPADPASAALLGIVAAGATLVAVSVMFQPGTLVMLVQVLMAGLVLACIAALANGKGAPPAMVQTARFTRHGTIRIEVERQGAPPEVTEMSFGDVAEIRVHTIANHGTRSDTMMLARRQGRPIVLAYLMESARSPSHLLAVADGLRAWTGLPGPGNTLLNSVALWASSTGRL